MVERRQVGGYPARMSESHRVPHRLLIHGASGRMGQTLLRLVAERDDLHVVAAVAPPANDAGLLGIDRKSVV